MPANAPSVTPKQDTSSAATGPSGKNTLLIRWALLGFICLITFVSFSYSVHNQFTNWDDDVYITNDPYIKNLNADNIKTIFTQDITKNNYHPLTMLSLAVNYYFSQLNPTAYYLTNILIHTANVVMVFLLFITLCARLNIDERGAVFIASFGALWFGVHPMHVESVSWIAERKDVLYAFFYLLGLLSYLKYLREGKAKWYWATFVLFIASCLSKPMAVVFPLSMLCLDILLKRKWSNKIITEKILFFAGALVCGGLAYYTQKMTGAIAPFGVLTIQDRIMYASYGFIMYIGKLFVPAHLSTFYPYPYHYIDGSLPGIYYLAPFIALAIITLPLYFAWKYNRGYFRIILFGIGFFAANIVFVLQFISCGAAIMADRYSYVSYIGLFFMIAWFAYELIKHIPSVRVVVTGILILLSAELSYFCYQRTYAWHNAATLLTDAIEQYPYQALLSYKWLGNYYMEKGEPDSALQNYSVLAKLNSADAKIYDNIGNIYRAKKDYKQALDAYQKSLAVQNNVYKTYLDRSMTYTLMGDSANAFRDYALANQLNPGTEKANAEIGFSLVQNKQYEQAIAQYNMLLKLNPDNPFYYFYRGVALFGEKKLQQAKADWLIAVQFTSKDVQPNAAYNLAVLYDNEGNDSAAVRYAIMARQLGYKVNADYMESLEQKKIQKGR